MTTNIVTAVVTAYCSCKLCCGPTAKGITANGNRPIQGTTIAASRKIPLGSSVRIDGHHYVVQDRLARRYDSRFDIYFNRHADAKKFGIKTQQVKVIIK
jgi:3D (Asp-Asp-Asp) domain-containing protein